MRSSRSFLLAGTAALVSAALALLVAVAVAGAGVAGLTGRVGHYPDDVRLVPGLGLATVHFQPSWEVHGGGPVCDQVRVSAATATCYGFVLSDTTPRVVGGVVQQGDLRPVEARLSGPLLLDPETGWNPLVASLYGMEVLGLLVLALVLLQLGLLLRAAGHGEPFTAQAVRRLRVIGAVIVGWELLQPVLWLFLSPKAWDYSESSYSEPWLSLGSMEPGGLSATRIAIGLLLLLLAEVVRRGAELADEHRLTV